MKKVVVFSLLFIFALSCGAFAQPAEQTGKDYLKSYEEARLRLAAANACLATYDDRVGNMFYHFMQHDGWAAERINKQGDKADANIFIAKKYDAGTGKTSYILSFRGSASGKDWQLDRNVSRVLFRGNSVSEIRTNAFKGDAPESEPKVHSGFLRYTMAVFSVDLAHSGIAIGSEYLHEVIKEDPKSELVVTGHSLGGAAAVLYAAAVINMGVPESQVKVITFGAPAVGNKAFADAYADKINMTRVYSPFDPVPKALQSFYSYEQFGKAMSVKADPRLRTVQHSMENYADLIGKNFYDCKDDAIANGVIAPDPVSYDEGDGPVVAIAVIAPEYEFEDRKYAVENLLDIYRWNFLRYRILDASNADLTMAQWGDRAKAAGADYLLLAKIGMNRVRVSRSWVVDLSQGVFRVSDSSLFSGLDYSVKVAYRDSLFQASAYNGFKAVEELYARGAGWVRPLAYQEAAGE